MAGMNRIELTINRRVLNAGLLAAVLLTWLPAGGFVLWVFAGDFARAPCLFEGTKLAAALGIVAGIVAYTLYYCLYRSACRARFGEAVVFETFLRRRQVPWEEVGRLVLKEQATPLPIACVLKLVLTDGTRFDVFASREQAELIFRRAQESPWARRWPGCPLGKGTVVALLGLGLVAALTGFWLDAILVQELGQRGAAALAAPGPPPPIGQLLALALGLPLVGLAALAFALYHLLRRPVVIRAGIIRMPAGQAGSHRELLEALFGTQE